MHLSKIDDRKSFINARPARVVLSVRAPDSRVIHEVIRLTAHPPEGPDDKEQLAVTTVLLSVAGSDRRYSPLEMREAYDLLEKRFKLSPRQVHRYIERVALLFTVQGRKRLTRNAIQFLRIRKDIVYHRELFMMAAKMVRADRKIAPGEIGWLKQFVRDLSLTARDCREALNLPAH